MTKFKNKRGRNVLFGILAILLFLGTIEGATRTVSWLSGEGFALSLHELEPYDKAVEGIYAWHPFIGITMKPDCSFVAGHPNQKEQSSVFVDKHGFLSKDQSLEYQKKDNEIRIATIGASTTANINLAFDDNWPGRLGTLVQNAMPNNKIRVINAAIPGCDTAQSIGNLALRVMPFRPDVVVIYHGYNDLKAIRSDVQFQPDYAHIHRTPFGHQKKPNVLIRCLNRCMFYVRTRNLYRDLKTKKKIYESVSNASPEGIRLTRIPDNAAQTFEQHMRTLIAIAKSEGAIVVIPSFATLHDPHQDYTRREIFEQLSDLQKVESRVLMNFIPGLTVEAIFGGINSFNIVLRQIALKEKVVWVDNASMIPHQDRYFVDRVHFTREGADRMARNLFPHIIEKLRQR